MKTNKINKDRFIINKDVAINEYREYIKDSSLNDKRVECRFYTSNFNPKDGTTDVSFKKTTLLHITILVNNYKCNWKDFNISKKSKFFSGNRLTIQNENDLINLIDEFNFIVKNSSFKKLEHLMLIANKFPRHKNRPSKNYPYEARFINNKNKAKYQKTKTKTLPRSVWWDLGEDLEFVNEQDVKRFKACFVWYYIYAKKPKYIKRSKTVEKYKLMFERMNKMISEESYLEHLGRS